MPVILLEQSYTCPKKNGFLFNWKNPTTISIYMNMNNVRSQQHLPCLPFAAFQQRSKNSQVNCRDWDHKVWCETIAHEWRYMRDGITLSQIQTKHTLTRMAEVLTKPSLWAYMRSSASPQDIFKFSQLMTLSCSLKSTSQQPLTWQNVKDKRKQYGKSGYAGWLIKSCTSVFSKWIRYVCPQ